MLAVVFACGQLLASLLLPRGFALTLVGDLVQCVLLLLVLLSVLPYANRSRGRARAFWILIFIGLGMWFCSQALWTYFEVFLRREVPNPFAGDIILFLHLVPMIAALALKPHLKLDNNSVRAGWLDFVLLLIWGLYLYLFVVIPWQYVSPNDEMYGKTFNLLYFSEHLIFLSGLAVLRVSSDGLWRRVYAHLFGAAFLYSASSVIASVAIDFHKYYTGSFYDLPLVAALAWFTVVGLFSGELPQEERLRDEVESNQGIWPARVAMAAVYSSPLMVMWALFMGNAALPIRMYRLQITLGAMLLMGALVTLRGHLIQGELTRLLRGAREALDVQQRLQAERQSAQARVEFLAYYDALTELPNRTFVNNQLVKACAGARRRHEKVAVLFLDLDRFKFINDSLGHAVGDLLLQHVARRIKGWAREQDTVARLGGDEFLIVLDGIKEIGNVAVAAERLMDAMNTEFVVEGQALSVTCSLGISVFPDHGVDAETLVKHADAAMYCAKENSRNNFQFFTENMNAQAVERLTLEHNLRKALERKELFLAYQPQMEIASGRFIGLEALLRWQHPEMGLVPPDKFIRIAENSGLIVPIGEWVLRTACAQVRKWHDERLLEVPIAVNVSAIQFGQEGFCQLIRKVLHETGLASDDLELELTESLLLSHSQVMLSELRKLKEMGVKLAIDDFGTGYSSLSYLRQFPVSKLKIDRSFIQCVSENADDAAITSTIISMAKNLHLKVIAEGVETEEQMSFLRARQCDEIQGYYFSKPLLADELADKLRVGGLAVKKRTTVGSFGASL